MPRGGPWPAVIAVIGVFARALPPRGARVERTLPEAPDTSGGIGLPRRPVVAVRAQRFALVPVGRPVARPLFVLNGLLEHAAVPQGPPLDLLEVVPPPRRGGVRGQSRRLPQDRVVRGCGVLFRGVGRGRGILPFAGGSPLPRLGGGRRRGVLVRGGVEEVYDVVRHRPAPSCPSSGLRLCLLSSSLLCLHY